MDSRKRTEFKLLIAEFRAQLLENEKLTANTKSIINRLSLFLGDAPLYEVGDQSASAKPTTIRSGQFRNMSLGDALCTILEIRHAASSWHATVDELYDSLFMGGFRFRNRTVGEEKRTIRSILECNLHVFSKHSHDDRPYTFGLREWYRVDKRMVACPKPSKRWTRRSQ